MRVDIDEPLGSAWEAARPIAQMVWRVVMALKSPSSSAVMLAEQGKARVNRR
jgi:hypothetical protein